MLQPTRSFASANHANNSTERFSTTFFLSHHHSSFPAQLATCLDVHLQRASRQAVVTFVFPSPPLYIHASIFIALKVEHAHFSAFYARRIASNSPTRDVALLACQILLLVRQLPLRGSKQRHRPHYLRGLLLNHQGRICLFLAGTCFFLFSFCPIYYCRTTFALPPI